MRWNDPLAAREDRHRSSDNATVDFEPSSSTLSTLRLGEDLLDHGVGAVVGLGVGQLNGLSANTGW